jgi:hypothetical protein
MPQEPTTASRKSRATERLAPPAPARKARAPLPGPIRWAIFAGVLAAVAGAVFLLARTSDPMRDTHPTQVVQGFAAALEARDASKALAYVEPTVFRREISPEVRSYVEYLQEVRFENARYELLDSDGEVAHVRWTATMHYTLNLGSETKSGDRPIDTTFELRQVEGNWYLHDAKLPKT